MLQKIIYLMQIKGVSLKKYINLLMTVMTSMKPAKNMIVRTEIILKVMEFSIKNSTLCKNMKLKMKLNVKKGNIEIDWIMMKRQSIFEGGFGLLALRDFEEINVITLYLGDKVNTEEKLVYVFFDIN